jgi:hypothetical protein
MALTVVQIDKFIAIVKEEAAKYVDSDELAVKILTRLEALKVLTAERKADRAERRAAKAEKLEEDDNYDESTDDGQPNYPRDAVAKL